MLRFCNLLLLGLMIL